MPASLAVTVSPDAVSLSRTPSGLASKEVTFTVTNTGARTVTVRAVLEPRGSVRGTWLEVLGELERDVAPDATHTFTVRVDPPPDASPGRHAFRLNVVDVHRSDEGEVQGPEVAFDVPAPVPDDGPAFPRWLLYAVLGVVAVGALAVAAVVFLPLGPGQEEVPRLVGSTVTDATQATEAAGFTLRVAEEVVAPTAVDAGTVARQAPEADVVAEEGSEVVVTLAGPPDVRGMTRSEAQDALRAVGLTAAVAGLTPASGRDVGRVASQEPGPGVRVEPGAEVALSVGGAVVPGLVGQNVNDALRMLAGTQLAFEVSSAFRSSAPDGTVVAQTIAEGEVVEAGTSVRLSVAATLDIDVGDLIDPALRRRFDLPIDFTDTPIPPIGPGSPIGP